jgi:hypothetical protein
MKYMVMLFGDQATMVETRSLDWIKEMIEFMTQVDLDLKESGELVFDAGLADPTQAKTVVIEDGIPVPTDGPFAESKESLAGFWVIDVEDEARALEFASKICYASSRRRSSGHWCAGTASSTRARTPSRRRC